MVQRKTTKVEHPAAALASRVTDDGASHRSPHDAKDTGNEDAVAVAVRGSPKGQRKSPHGSSSIPAEFATTQAFASPRDFFVAPADGNDQTTVVCTFCQKAIGARMFSLKRHLYRHHPQVFRLESSSGQAPAVVREEKDLRKPAPAAAICSLSTVRLKQEAPTPRRKAKRKNSGSSVQPPSPWDQCDLNEALVKWLSSDVIPMKALGSAHFQSFLKHLNPAFAVPQVEITPQEALPSSLSIERKEFVVGPGPTTMQGFCLLGDGSPPQLHSDLPRPTPAANEALIKVVRAGICGTDMEMANSYKAGFKGVLGHEFVGIVERIGGDTQTQRRHKHWLGKRVVGEINVPCEQPECHVCASAGDAVASTVDHKDHASHDAAARRRRIKKRNHCPSRTCLGIVGRPGVFAEYVILPVANLLVVPECILDSHAVFMEPLAAACRILEQQTIRASDRVVVLGDGKLGLLVVEVLHAQAVAKEITLVGKHHLGMMQGIATMTLEYAPSLAESLAGAYDVCIECTGTPSGVSMALQLIKPQGTVLMKSTCSAKKSHVPMPQAQRRQARILGSRCGPFEPALELLQSKRVELQKLIHGVYPLERAAAAFAHAQQRGALKIQLLM